MKKLVISTAIAFMMAAPAYADIAVSITGGSGGTPANNSVHGWEFTVNSDIILTHLGLYDRDLDGFFNDHDIGLFRLSDGALLTSGTMSAGTGDPLIDNFRYIDVADVPLLTTENYVLSYYTAFDSGDFVVTNATGEVFAPEVNWISGRFGGDAGGLIIPPNSTGDDRYGPNFQFVIDGNCPWDVNGDGVVDHHDIVEVVHNMGQCDDPDNCPWDVNGDGIVNGRDVAAVATHFGPCLKGQCTNDCGTGDIDEGEPCLVDLGEDTTNGGCNSDPAVFAPVVFGPGECSVIICGSGSTYDRDTNGDGIPDSDVRDTDWYLVDAATLALADEDGNGEVLIRSTVTAEFPAVTFIVALGDPACTSPAVVGQWGFSDPFCGTGDSAEFTVILADHPNGIVAFVAPGNPDGSVITEGIECKLGANDVTIEIRLIDNNAHDLDGDGVVSAGDVVMLVHNFGPCDGGCPADSNEDGVVDVLDLLALLANWGPCP